MTGTIRHAAAADAAAIADIFRHYVEHTVVSFHEAPPSAADWERRITAGRPFLVDEEAGQVVGFAYVAPWRSQPAYRVTVEDAVYLARTATGRGRGTALLTQLIAICRTAGYEQMIAVIAQDSDSASASARLHRRCGFRDVGVLTAVGAKHGRRLDTRLMQLDLTDGDRGQGR